MKSRALYGLLAGVATIVIAVVSMVCTKDTTTTTVTTKQPQQAQALLQQQRNEDSILNIKSQEVMQYTAQKHLHISPVILLIDMSVPSGKYRFFIYNTTTRTILSQGLTTHGVGSGHNTEHYIEFSNAENSNCTPLGKYIIGNSYYGQGGLRYSLIGLDTSNSKAQKRHIIIHTSSFIPNEEQDEPLMQSQGCPIVSEKFFAELHQFIQSQKGKKVMLYIFR